LVNSLVQNVNPILRNILAVIAGFVAGQIVNMSIIVNSGFVIAPPEGAIMTTTEGVKEAMARFEAKHFLMPFLAHALGTLTGGCVAALIAASHKMLFALVIGGLFLALGITMISMVGGPAWFITCDLGLAFLPMAWIGGKIGSKMTANTG